MFSWEYSEFMRVGVDPASDKSDKASVGHPRTYLIGWGQMVDAVLSQQHMDTGPLGVSRGVGYGSFGSCGMGGGASIDQTCSDTSDGCFNPTSKFPMRSSICWGSWNKSDSMEEPLWIAIGSDPSKSGHRTPEGVPWCVIRGVGKGSFESCGLWVEDSVNPTCSCTSQRCWKATAVGGVLLWRGVNSTLSRSLGGWCVLNCIPHENHKVSQHNTAL